MNFHNHGLVVILGCIVANKRIKLIKIKGFWKQKDWLENESVWPFLTMKFSKRRAVHHTYVQPEPENFSRDTFSPNDILKKYKKYQISTLQLSIDGSMLAKKIGLLDCIIACSELAKFEGNDGFVEFDVLP